MYSLRCLFYSMLQKTEKYTDTMFIETGRGTLDTLEQIN